MPDNTDSLDLRRYDRQMKYGPVGVEGQKRLLRSSSCLWGGCFGLRICRDAGGAGVGHLRIVDRDFLELNISKGNQHDESDVASGLPKAEAAVKAP